MSDIEAGGVYNKEKIIRLVKNSTEYGDPIFYFEMWIKKSPCLKRYEVSTEIQDKNKVALDIVMYFPEKDELVGVEIKDWKDNVTFCTVKKEFYGYYGPFDFIFLAARKLSESVHETLSESEEVIRKIGLIELEDGFLEITRDAKRLYSNSEHRKDTIRRIYNNWKRKKWRLKEGFGDLYREVKATPHPKKTKLVEFKDVNLSTGEQKTIPIEEEE